MPRDTLRVSVIRYPDREHLVLRYRDPLSGRFRTKSSRTANRRDAERLAAKLETELQGGRATSARSISWEQFRERYELEVVSGLAPATGRMVGTTFNAVESAIRPSKLTDLTANRLSYWVAELRKGGRAEATIKTYSAHLKAALNWAAGIGLLAKPPKMQRIRRARGGKLMKGRPITEIEFQRMLGAVAEIVGDKMAPHWSYFLRGLWCSGLRLQEAVDLYWDRPDRLCVDLSGDLPPVMEPAFKLE